MFHASVSLSDVGLEPETVSGTGSMDKLDRKKLGPAGRGIGIGISCGPASVVGLPTVDLKGGVDVRVGGDELRRSSVDDVFFLQRRGIIGDGSVGSRRGWGSPLRLSEGRPVPASGEVAREGLGGLNFFNK